MPDLSARERMILARRCNAAVKAAVAEIPPANRSEIEAAEAEAFATVLEEQS